MAEILVYTAGVGGAAPFTAHYLKKAGFRLIEHPSPEVTHLLLDIPCREIPSGLLDRLPEDITVVGGNLDRTELAGYRKLDLLKLEGYLAQNAAITADCALRVAASRMRTVFSGASVLVIGWGRIGKCLAALLKGLEADVTVAARKEADRAILHALDYRSTDTENLNCAGYRVIFNTAPATILPTGPAGCLKIDLASTPGIGGSDVIHARGLPGKDAPEASGELIARTVLKYLNKEEIA